MSSTPRWVFVPARDSIPSYSLFAEPLEKPDLDDRDYAIVELENGLRAILVHDVAADKAAACLTIAVGHLQDPVDVPGLAHFCEHMLSKGSEPYPAENDFLSFITSNGGNRNAGTGAALQDYWFSINPDLLFEALPRLAAFFHSPLFTPSLTRREIHAVDSENKRNLQNDARRIFQIEKSLSVPGHPWTKFGTGNYASLTEAARGSVEHGGGMADGSEDDGDGGAIGRETRRRLLTWWEQEYCAERMALAVVGKESLHELIELTSQLFSPIPRRGADPRPIVKESAWGPSEMGSIVFLKTVKDKYGFSLSFLLTDQTSNFKTHPARIITHFLGHEGPGSIYAYLKRRGWLVDICATGPSPRNRSVQQLEIEGTLTREGYMHYEDVIVTIYHYLSLLRSSPLELYHFNEISQMSTVSFRFREKAQPHVYAKTISSDLLCCEPQAFWPTEWMLSASARVREWDEELVRNLLGVLTPEKGRVLLWAKDHDVALVNGEGGRDVVWEKEKWYGTEYYIRRLGQDLLEKANAPNANTDLALPHPNPYIPEDLTVDRNEVSTPSKAPRCIRHTPISALWFKKDDQFWVPKAQIRLNIISPLAYATPRHAVLTRLLADLLEDALAESTYQPQLAGLGYSISNQKLGLFVSVHGYNDKLPVLLDAVMEKFQTLVIDPDRLKVISDEVGRTYNNFYLSQPSVLGDYYASSLLAPVTWSPQEKRAELPFITADDVQRHKAELLSKIFIEALVTGNVHELRALQMIQSVESRLAARPLSSSERPQDRSLVLPSGTNFVMTKMLTDPKELNSSLTYFCQFGDVSDALLRPALQLLTHIIKEPLFSQLRTVEQLGYIVASSMWSSTGSMGLAIKIQSLKVPSVLEERVEAFLGGFGQSLKELSAEQFEAKKEGLIIRKLEKVKNLNEETSRFWSHISSGYYDFLQNETDSEAIRQLTLEDIVATFDQFLLPGSQSRRKISVQLASQQLTENPLSSGVILIDDERLFKAGLCCSPAAKPVPQFQTHALESEMPDLPDMPRLHL